VLYNIIQGKITLIIILSLIFSLIFTFVVLAAEVEPGDNYVLRADDITFLQAEGQVLFEGNASFESSDFVVESKKITVDTNAKTIKALEDVVIHSDKDDLYGDSLTYNYENETGELYGAEGSIGEINFSGKTLKILSVSPIAAEMEAAEFTPCIRKEPHYHFKAKEIKINDDNTLDIFHIVPYIWKTPVFYLPYYSVEYDPDSGEGSPLKTAVPVPKLGYDSDRGVTTEFKYPYQLNDKTSGEIFYLTEGREYDRYEVRRITNFYQLTDNFTIKNRYDYLYNYDLDDEELDDYEEEFFTSLKYERSQYAIEAGVGRDLRADDNENRYLLTGRYNFLNGLNTSFRQEYDFDWERVKERYLMNYSQHSINWDLKYIDGESYNYYPYLTLDFPSVLGVKTTLGTGRVENEGVELNKERINLRYNFAYPLTEVISYHLDYNYRLDHYRSSYYYNYHYTSLNTGVKYKTRLNQKMELDSSLFFEKNYPWGKSPLPDDREDQDRFIKPGLSLNIDRDLEQSSFKISSNAIYDLDLDDWDEINLRFTQDEDCYTFYLNYEFVDDTISFGIEI
jgi:LPS-assembly protein